MTTYAFNAEVQMNATEALTIAMYNANVKKGKALSIQAFTAFKVEGLWVITITYK